MLHFDHASDDVKKKRDKALRKYSKFIFNHKVTAYPEQEKYIDLNPNKECFEENLKIFKLAFNSKDEDIRTGLWNSLDIDDDLDLNVLKEHLTSEEYAFIKEYVDNMHNIEKYDKYLRNINKGFDNGNIKLVPAFGRLEVEPRYSNRDCRAFEDHLINDGDFESFALYELSDTDIDHTTIRFSNLSFFIHLMKTDEVIGYISFESTSDIIESIKADIDKADVSFYIFKEYRNKGYATETLRLLTGLAFENELKVPKATVRVNKYDFVYINFNIISAYCLTDNTASIRTLEKCGFEKMGLIHSYCQINNEYRDVYYFELFEDQMYLNMFFDEAEGILKEKTKEKE